MDWVLVLGICGFVYGVVSDIVGELNIPENSNIRLGLKIVGITIQSVKKRLAK